jgi:hypothetical protein
MVKTQAASIAGHLPLLGRRIAAALVVFFSLSGAVGAAQEIDEQQALLVLWSTMLALDHANDSVNYSVFREIASPDFQEKNSPQQLNKLFSQLRASRIDIGLVLTMMPEYEIPPQIGDSGLLRMRGRFNLQPASLNFDLLYKELYGEWRLVGIAVVTGESQVSIKKKSKVRMPWFKR